MPKDFWVTFSNELSIVVLGQEVGPKPLNNSGNRPLRFASESINRGRTSKFKELRPSSCAKVTTYEYGLSIQPYNRTQLSYGGRIVLPLLYLRDMYNRRETRGDSSEGALTPPYFG